jgi:hypothetical protein
MIGCTVSALDRMNRCTVYGLMGQMDVQDVLLIGCIDAQYMP